MLRHGGLKFLQHELLNDFSNPAALVISFTHIVADSADFIRAVCHARTESGCADHCHIIVIISDRDDLRDIDAEDFRKLPEPCTFVDAGTVEFKVAIGGVADVERS